MSTNAMLGAVIGVLIVGLVQLNKRLDAIRDILQDIRAAVLNATDNADE